MVGGKKIEVLNNAAAVGIIYRTSDPQQVFLEIKDAGYPRKTFVGMGCLIGGNWVGESARNDKGPMDTFLREVEEELSFSGALIDPIELRHLHGIENLDLNASRAEVTPLPQDEHDLAFLVSEIKKNTIPYRVHIVSVPEEVFRRKEPNYSRGDLVGLVGYYTVGLPENVWMVLERLQKKFGNLSNESITLITSLNEVVATGFQISWGHDQTLKQFFLDQGLAEARGMFMVPGIKTRYLGVPTNSYTKYLERLEFKVTPWTK